MRLGKGVLLLLISGCIVGLPGCIGKPMPSARRIDVTRLTEVALGPFYRKDMILQVSADSNLPVDGDLFEFALLHGHPPHGRYDWFKIAREEKGAVWYLVLGSSDNRLEWVEIGALRSDERSGTNHFVLERVDGAEGEREKNVREFIWREEKTSAVTVLMKNYRKIAFSPAWGEPQRLEVSLAQP